MSQSDATTVNKTAFELNSNFLEETESKITNININPSMISSTDRNSNDGIETNRDEKTKKEMRFFKVAAKNEELTKKNVIKLWQKASLSTKDLDFVEKKKNNWRHIDPKKMSYYMEARKNNSSDYDSYKNYIKNHKKMNKIMFDLMGFDDLEEAGRFKEQFNLIKRNSFIGKPSFSVLNSFKKDQITNFEKEDGNVNNIAKLGVISEKSRSTFLNESNISRKSKNFIQKKVNRGKAKLKLNLNYHKNKSNEVKKSRTSFGILSTSVGIKNSFAKNNKNFESLEAVGNGSKIRRSGIGMKNNFLNKKKSVKKKLRLVSSGVKKIIG